MLLGLPENLDLEESVLLLFKSNAAHKYIARKKTLRAGGVIGEGLRWRKIEFGDEKLLAKDKLLDMRLARRHLINGRKQARRFLNDRRERNFLGLDMP